MNSKAATELDWRWPSAIQFTVLIILACIGMHLLAAMLSSITTSGGLGAIGAFLNEPNNDVQDDLGNGGMVPFLQGDLWSLLSSCFMHIDLSHLVGNMLFLAILFPYVARALGPVRTFAVYSLAGLGGSLAAIVQQELYSRGASGGLCGLFGALIVIGLREGGPSGIRTAFMGLILAASSFAVGPVGEMQVSNAAHAGGLAVGLVSTFLLQPAGKTGVTRYIYEVSVALTALSLAFGIGNGVWRTAQARYDPTAYAAHLADSKKAAADEILALTPKTADDHLLRGEIYRERSRFDEAVAEYTLAVERGAGREAYSQRGSAYIALKQYENAIADFGAAIKMQPNDAQSLNNRAWALFLIGRPADGLPDVEKSLRLEPDSAPSLDTRAHIFEALGQHDKAIADYRAVLAKDPGIAESREGLKRLGASQ